MMAAETMQPTWQLSELLEDIVSVPPGQDTPVHRVVTDSRDVQAGDLFLACAGTKNHGLQFMEEVLRCGAAAVAWEPTSDFQNAPDSVLSHRIPVVAVQGLSAKVGHIASRYFGNPSRDMYLIGVTGTDGKTSCSHFVAQALTDHRTRCGVIGTLGNGIYGQLQSSSLTTPDPVTVQSLLSDFRSRNIRNVVMEVSSHALDQGRVNGARFSSVLFTNLGRDHLDYHGSVEEYARAKRRLFEQSELKTAVLNIDDPFSEELSGVLPADTRLLAYGSSGLPGWIQKRPGLQWVLGSALDSEDPKIAINIETSQGVGVLRSSLVGEFNAKNLLGALGVLLANGLDLADSIERLSRVHAVPGRMECFGGEHGQPLIIVDYAHTPQALEHALIALRKICTGSLVCVFGAGGDRDCGKRALMGNCAERIADQVILTDDNPRLEDPKKIIADILSGFSNPERVQVEHNRAAAIQQAFAMAKKGDVILIAGKGHEQYQQVGSEKISFDDRLVAKNLISGGQS